MTPSNPSPDTGAGTPLTAEEKQVADFLKRLRHVDRDILVWIRDVLAERDELRAARSRPATDPAGLDVLRLAQAIRDHDDNCSLMAIPECATAIAAEYARLSVAHGPGPEERPDLEAAARTVVEDAEPDESFEGEYVDYLVPFAAIDALRAALPVHREETGRS